VDTTKPILRPIKSNSSLLCEFYPFLRGLHNRNRENSGCAKTPSARLNKILRIKLMCIAAQIQIRAITELNTIVCRFLSLYQSLFKHAQLQ